MQARIQHGKDKSSRVWSVNRTRNCVALQQAATEKHAAAVAEYRRNLFRKAASVGMTLEQYCSRFNINIMKDIAA